MGFCTHHDGLRQPGDRILRTLSDLTEVVQENIGAPPADLPPIVEAVAATAPHKLSPRTLAVGEEGLSPKCGPERLRYHADGSPDFLSGEGGFQF